MPLIRDQRKSTQVSGQTVQKAVCAFDAQSKANTLSLSTNRAVKAVNAIEPGSKAINPSRSTDRTGQRKESN
eukprot:3308109-Rhodomonas_salina.2